MEPIDETDLLTRTRFLSILLAARTVLQACCEDPGPEQPLQPEFDPSAVGTPYCATDEAKVDALYEGMSLRQRIGQHVITSMSRSGNEPTDETRQLIEDYHLSGGFLTILYAIDVSDPMVTAQFVNDLQTMAYPAGSDLHDTNELSPN